MAQKGAQPITSVEHIPGSERGKGFPPFDAHTFASQLFWLALAFIALYFKAHSSQLSVVSSQLTGSDSFRASTVLMLSSQELRPRFHEFISPVLATVFPRLQPRVAPPSRRLSWGRPARTAEGEPPSGQPARCRRYKV